MRPTRTKRKAGGDSGLVTTELAVVFPLILVAFILAIFAARVQQQNTTVQGAADAAARAAALHLDSGSAESAAQTAAEANKGSCESISVTGFEWPTIDPFTPGAVIVEVTCTESMSDLGAVTSGDRVLAAVGRATVEFWRPDP